ncbi:Hypothetical protein NRBB11_0934 [Bifidobacterium breve]|uniref:hypothetical protein n=1 Tax=Bifidobacterium breve TaxID=1685 RepID=UPI000CA352E7|nr:hypothetical protein [Bifidobacterium breve]AUD74672.1 Hypothetical protein NRBB11_0934 [Bifidobacterium breve]
MGLFDSLKNMFAHHEHHHGGGIGQPLTLADAKAVLCFVKFLWAVSAFLLVRLSGCF